MVADLWRYPVKSLGGERVRRLALEPRGVIGDRRWAVTGADGRIGSGKTTRRFRRMPGLLSLQAGTDGDGSVWVCLPDGSRRAVTDPRVAALISTLVGEAVTLSEEGTVPHLDDSPVHLVATGAVTSLEEELGAGPIDVRRFRPNVVVEAADDGGWSGRVLRLGGAVIEIEKPTVRCVMVTMAQPGVERRLALLGELERRHAGRFGQYARVVRPGMVAVGDPVTAS